MSRIESGKVHLEETEVNLSDVLHELRTMVSGQIRAKQLEFSMDAIDVTDEDIYCGMNGFLTKPIYIEELLTLLSGLLAG